MTIYLASDHGGWRQKQALADWLRSRGLTVRDLGPSKFDPRDDYPVWAARVARVVQRDSRSRGILLCRSGIGMAIATNKFSGIRAAQVFSEKMAKQSRRDENTNILSLAADYHTPTELKRLAWAWLQADYRRQPRFQRRLRQLARIEHAH